MPFEKGRNKTGGRKKGVENKDKKQIREFISMYLNEHTERLEQELNKLSGKDYINAITGLLEYSIPKLNRTEIKDESTKEIIVKKVRE